MRVCKERVSSSSAEGNNSNNDNSGALLVNPDARKLADCAFSLLFVGTGSDKEVRACLRERACASAGAIQMCCVLVYGVACAVRARVRERG